MAGSPISPQTVQLVTYGLIFGGSAIVGKLVIDNFVGEVSDKKARGAFIGPIRETPKKGDAFHARASEGVKFVVMAVSVYQLIAKLPVLINEWGDVERSIKTLSE